MKLTKFLSAVITAALLTLFTLSIALAQGEDCSKLKAGSALRKACEARNATPAPVAPGVQPTAKPGVKPTAAPAKIETSFTGEAGGDWALIEVMFPEDCQPETCALTSVKFTEGEPSFFSGWTDYPPTNDDMQKIEGGIRVRVRGAGLKPDTTYSYEVVAKVSGKEVKAQGKFRTGSAGFSLPSFGNIRLPSLDLMTGLIWLAVLAAIGFGVYLLGVFQGWWGIPPGPPPEAPL